MYNFFNAGMFSNFFLHVSAQTDVLVKGEGPFRYDEPLSLSLLVHVSSISVHYVVLIAVKFVKWVFVLLCTYVYFLTYIIKVFCIVGM